MMICFTFQLLTGAAGQSNPFISPAVYASAIAALNASRQATAASVALSPSMASQTSYPSSTTQASVAATNALDSSTITAGRKREVTDNREALEVSAYLSSNVDFSITSTAYLLL